MMHFAVFGAGYTGRRVLQLLSTHKVIAFSRSPLEQLPEHVDYRRLDLDRPLDKAIHLPAPCTLIYTIPPSQSDPDQRLSRIINNLDGTTVRRVVYLSTTGVYGQRDGARVVESNELQPATERAKRRVSAESLLRIGCETTDTELIVLRVPGIYGPGRLGRKHIAAGEPSIREAEANPGNRIHVDDLAACCVHAMTALVPAGTYNVGDGDERHRTNTWFRRTVAELAGLDAPPQISLASARQTFGQMRFSFIAEARRVDTTKMREVLGFTPKYADAKDGIRASIEASTFE